MSVYRERLVTVYETIPVSLLFTEEKDMDATVKVTGKKVSKVCAVCYNEFMTRMRTKRCPACRKKKFPGKLNFVTTKVTLPQKVGYHYGEDDEFIRKITA